LPHKKTILGATTVQEDIGKLVLRITVGGLLLLHGVHKLLNGIAPIKAMVASHNLPDAFAYGVYLGEVLGPILVILGLFARIGAGLIAINMLVAVALVGSGLLMSFNAMGGYALELEAFYFWGAVAIMLLGAGRISVAGGRWN
jgi:putative oxidoreductase